jgi:hypothetical protein
MDAGTQELTARRIQRDGRDMLCIQDSRGQAVGRVDLKTGATVLEQPRLREAFHGVVESWRKRNRGRSGSPANPPRSARPVGHVEPLAVVRAPDGLRSPGGPRPPRRPTEPSRAPVTLIKAEPGRAPVTLIKAEPTATRGTLGQRPAAPEIGQPAAADALPVLSRRRGLALRKPLLAQALSARLEALQRRPMEAQAALIAAEADRRLAARLGRLRPGWRLVSRSTVGWNSDEVHQLLVGPQGVFAIAPKYLPGVDVRVANDTVRVGGRHVKFIPRLRADIDRLASQLSESCGFSVDVVGVLVVTGARELALVPHPPDVGVVELRRLSRWLGLHPKIYEAETAEAIAERAASTETWHPSAA